MKYLNHNNLLFFRRLFASGVEAARRVLRLAARSPEYVLSVAAFGFYLYQLAHLPLFWRILFAGVGVLFTWGLIYTARVWLRRRLGQANLRLGPELAVAGLLVCGLYWTDFFLESWFVVILPAAFWLWLVWLSWRRRAGAFYAGFIGLLLFVLAVSAYRLLFVQEWLYGYASYYFQRQAAVAELERRYRWERGEDSRTLYREGVAVLTVPELPGVWFHDSRLISFIYGVPEPGVGICYLSASEQDPFAVPAVALFQADRLRAAVGSELFVPAREASGDAAKDEGAGVGAQVFDLSPDAESYLRESVERAVLLRRRNGEIESLEYGGRTRLPAFLQLEDLDGAPGIQYSYRDRVLGENARIILYVSPDRRYVLVVNDAPESGLLFEPATLAVLRRIRTNLQASH
ncbi:MAG: hypothetical protein RIF32_18530 [Leptospirales bacterium]